MALIELNIRNFAIIKQLEIEVDDGLTVVTGETGAGKSIVLDALHLLLGSRAESDMIRHGEDQCEITALFLIENLSDVKAWIEKRDLNNDADARYCLIRRIVRSNKPTKCYINDQPATLASLKELGLMLVDLHSQHEHQSLMRKPNQRRIIDQFAGHDDKLKLLTKLALQIRRISKELNSLTQVQSNSADHMEFMSFQFKELSEANIQEGEFEALEAEYSRLNNAQNLIKGVTKILDGLFHNEALNVSSELGKNINDLTELVEYDPHLQPASDLLNSALAQVEESQGALASALAKIDKDPERLAEISLRRDTIISLARKHRCKETELPARHQSLKEEYSQLESANFKPEALQKELEERTLSYNKIAQAVSEKRQKVAGQLSGLITEQMQSLGMKGGKLNIEVEQTIRDDSMVSEHGMDQIEFMVSTNYGMPLKALHKAASGGELSRISLAIQVITSQKFDTPTLVFDEVDVGVSGKVAQIVGKKLQDLGKNAQVICITHLPQVAAQGSQHMFIDKVTTDTETYSTIIKLHDETRIAEIARMLGGAEITDRTRAHAQEMLSVSRKTG